MVWKVTGTMFDGTWKPSAKPKVCPVHTDWASIKVKNGRMHEAGYSSQMYTINPTAAYDTEPWNNNEKYVSVVNSAQNRLFTFGTGRPRRTLYTRLTRRTLQTISARWTSWTNWTSWTRWTRWASLTQTLK